MDKSKITLKIQKFLSNKTYISTYKHLRKYLKIDKNHIHLLEKLQPTPFNFKLYSKQFSSLFQCPSTVSCCIPSPVLTLQIESIPIPSHRGDTWAAGMWS